MVQMALSEVLRLTANLCRLLFPERVVLTGPFVQTPEVFSRFVQTLELAPMLRSLDKIQVSVSSGTQSLGLAGALNLPFAAAVRQVLDRGEVCRTKKAVTHQVSFS